MFAVLFNLWVVVGDNEANAFAKRINSWVLKAQKRLLWLIRRHPLKTATSWLVIETEIKSPQQWDAVKSPINYRMCLEIAIRGNNQSASRWVKEFSAICLCSASLCSHSSRSSWWLAGRMLAGGVCAWQWSARMFEISWRRNRFLSRAYECKKVQKGKVRVDCVKAERFVNNLAAINIRKWSRATQFVSLNCSKTYFSDGETRTRRRTFITHLWLRRE